MVDLDDNLNVKINNIENFKLYKSHYLGNAKFTEEDRGYTVRFCHQVKTRNQEHRNYNKEIQGKLKQLGLVKQNNEFYINLSISIEENKVNNDIKYFMQSADLKKIEINLEKTPDEMTFASVDLNISNPITATKAKFYKNDHSKPLKSFGYGSGEFIEHPTFLVENGIHNNKIIKITNDCYMLKKIIKNFKQIKNHNAKFEFIKKEIDFLKIENENLNQLRYKIQSQIKIIKNQLANYSELLRKTGYNNLADCIRLLEAKDMYASLISSYERIHLLPGKSMPQKKKFDNTRANFRKLITRKLAYKIVDYAHDCNAVFVEDLNFDSDSDKNYLLRLFHCQTLLKFIEEGLNKRGIAMILTDKNGTSKVDPVTGELGYRDKKDKSKLYVKRNDKIVYIDSDLAACVNIMLKGTNHSICPYNFLLSNDEESDKQRIKTFKKLTGKDIPKSKERIYCFHPDKFISQSEKKQMEDIWQKWYEQNEFIEEKIAQVSVLENKTQICLAFSKPVN